MIGQRVEGHVFVGVPDCLVFRGDGIVGSLCVRVGGVCIAAHGLARKTDCMTLVPMQSWRHDGGGGSEVTLRRGIFLCFCGQYGFYSLFYCVHRALPPVLGSAREAGPRRGSCRRG